MLLIKRDRYVILAFLIPLLFFVFSLNVKHVEEGVQSCIRGTQYSMWKNHTFDLGEEDNPYIRTIDKGLFKGKYYCAVSPGLAFLSLPFAAHGFVMDGGNFESRGYSMIMDELFLAISASFASLFVYKISRLYARRVPSLLASITFALATTVWPMATVIYINDASVLFSTAAVYLVLRNVQKEENRSLTDPVTAGLSLGLASFIEYMTILFAPLLAVYMFYRMGSKRTTIIIILVFLFASSVGPMMHFIYNYSIFEDPFVFPEQLKPYKAEMDSQSLYSRFTFDELPLHAVAYIISPYRGLILFSPVLILGMYQLYQMVKSKSSRYRAEGTLFISLFLVILLPYSAWHDWTGGPTYGPRFLISVIPFMTIPVAVFLSDVRSIVPRVVFLLLFGMSSFIQGAGALTSAYVLGHRELFVYPPYAYNIPLLLEGSLSTWLFSNYGIGYIADGRILYQLLSAVLFLCLWSIVALFTIKSIRATRAITLAEEDD